MDSKEIFNKIKNRLDLLRERRNEKIFLKN